MPPPEQSSAPQRALSRSKRWADAARNFWHRVTEGAQLEDLWSQFAAEARESYGFYSRDVDWAAMERAPRWKRPFHIAGGLFWAMLLKLSPARRVLLLLAIVLLLFPGSGMRSSAHSTGGFISTGGLHFLAALCLFVLLALELADRVAMKRDLEIAREIQQWLVPAAAPVVPGVEMAFATRPANTVAGDYYDAFLRPAPDAASGNPPEASRLLVVVADVAGKSVPAALLMATFQASLRALAALPSSLVELVAELNRYACAHSLDGRRFTTSFLAELDPATRALTYINAGHNIPVLRRASGRFERLEAGGLPLGIETGARYDSGSASLAPGDVLVIFTDGVPEAVDEDGEEFGEPRLLELLRTKPGSNASATLNGVMAAVDTFVGAARQHDDITCLVLHAL